MEKIKVGISSCLLGNSVRYNGQHQLDSYLKDTLGEWCQYVPVCPEVECGLSVPREAMRLVGDPDNPRLMTSNSGVDHTERMVSWSEQKLKELEEENMVAFIFKTKSPSSGMRKVKVYNEKGQRTSFNGIGMFARAFMNHFPDIPVEDEGRLKDPGLREQFIETIFVLQRWRDALKEKKAKSIVQFHTIHKYTFMAHSPQILKEMGQTTAVAGTIEIEELIEQYRGQLNRILRVKKDRKKNFNVIQHLLGYFKKNLTSEEKAELLQEAQLYYEGISPLIVPLTLLRHYSKKYNEDYLLKQTYLNPHPVELGLLNHV